MSDIAKDTKSSRTEAESLSEVMKKYDRESNVRVFTGKAAIAVKAVLIAFSLFCIWVTLFSTFLEEIRLTSFMGMIVFLGFLQYPANKNNVRVNHIPWYDLIGMIFGSGAFLYYTFRADQIIQQGTRFAPYQIIIAVIGIVVTVRRKYR